MDAMLITAWERKTEEGCWIYPHSHDYHELVYYTSGRGISNIGGTPSVFSGGSFCLLAPRTVHDESHRENGSLFCLGLQINAVLPQGVFPDSQGHILEYVRAILKESTQQSFGYKEMLHALLTAMLVELLRTLGGSEARPEPHNFEYVVNFLAANYAQKIRFSEIAARMDLSYDYFQHRFRKLQGVSPQQFLQQKRLEAARDLLNSTALSCTEIAYRCGFSNSAQFSMLFKRAYGCSPRDFRKP